VYNNLAFALNFPQFCVDNSLSQSQVMSPALSYHLKNSTFRPHLLLLHGAYLRASELDRRRPPTLRTALKQLAHCSQAPVMTDAALQNDRTQSVSQSVSHCCSSIKTTDVVSVLVVTTKLNFIQCASRDLS
jgi:hypothetical protein